MTLNELNGDNCATQSTLPPTDCRFRPDVKMMENGDIGIQSSLFGLLLVGSSLIVPLNASSKKQTIQFDS